MPKKYYARKRRSTPRRRKTIRRRRSSMNRMQKAAYSYVKKKYTTVLPIRVGVGQDNSNITISHIGGPNSTNPGATATLFSANPDAMAASDMRLYQFAKITGVAFKLFFPEGTTPEATPVQWSLGYSANNVLNPDLTFGPLQSLATFQTSGCSAKVPIKRYFKTGTTLKRLGIEWFDTREYTDFSNAAAPVPLYGDQLPANAGSSTLVRVFRSGTATATASEIGRLQLTYYVQYKGAKG